jgi:dihydrofolate reductase
MGKLTYGAIASLDGYVEDADGGFDWAEPDEELHAFVNDVERPIGTYLYGRRMYETMAFWETAGLADDDEPEVFRDYATLWRAADKVVFSRTLTAVTSERTRIEPAFDIELVRKLKGGGPDLSIGGADLAGQAIEAGLVDEILLFLVPVLVGGGKRALPDRVQTRLRLLESRAFSGGVVFVRYAVDA